MKVKTLTVCCMAALMAMVGCETPTSSGGGGKKPDNPVIPNDPEKPIEPGTAKYGEQFRGEWIRMDTGDRWYISGDSIKVNKASSNLNVTLEKTSDNVVVAKGTGNQTYTLFAARVANAGFTAQVVFLDEAEPADNSRSSQGTTGQKPPIKIVNQQQPDKVLVVEPDPETGEIVVDGIIPGDLIELIPDDPVWEQIKVDLTPGWGDEQDMGVIALTQGDNFKVSLRMDNSSVDITELYADGVPRDYIFEIENISASNSGQTELTILWDNDDFILSSGTPRADFANIRPGIKGQIRLTLISKPIETGYRNKEFRIGIQNYDSRSRTVRSWDDKVSVNYYKVPVPFRFRSEKQVQGIIQAKRGGRQGKSYHFKTVQQGSSGDYTATVLVPWSSQEYTVAFLGATVEEETATHYSFAINDLPPSNWDALTPFEFIIQYKPDNEFEETAPVIDLATGAKTFMGFLAGGSVDYYKIRLGNEPPEFNIIEVDDWDFQDLPGGYYDGEANPGDTFNLDFVFVNNSQEHKTLTMTGLVSDLAHSEFVEIVRLPTALVSLPAGHYGTLSSGTTSALPNTVPLLNTAGITRTFQFRLKPNCPPGSISLTVTFRDDMNLEYAQVISFDVVMPPIQIVLDSENARASSGESFNFAIQAKNTGTRDAYSVTAKLLKPESQYSGSLNIVTSGTVPMGLLAAGGAPASVSFDISINSSCPAGVEIPVQVEFTNSEGNKWYGDFSIYVLPSVPGYVQVTAVSETGIRVSWNSVSGATSYKVYDAEGYVLANLGNVLIYEHTNRSAGTVYMYRVSAIAGTDESSRSAVVSARTWERLVFNTQYSGTVSAGIPHYYRFNAASEALYRFITTAAGTARYESGDASWFALSSGTVDRAAGQSGWVYIRIDNPGTYSLKVEYPLSPLNIKTEALSQTNIRITWDTVVGAKSYIVYHSTSSDGTYDKIETVNHPDTVYTHSGVAENITHYYKVSTVNNDDLESSPSAAVAYFPLGISGDISVTEQSGNGDGHINPGETAQLNITVKNFGSSPVENLQISLNGFDSYGTVTNRNQGIGTLYGNTETTVNFYLNISYSCPIGSVESLTISLNENGGLNRSWTDTVPAFDVTLPAPVNVRAEALSESLIRISWNQVIGASGYNIYNADGGLVATVGYVLQFEHSGCDSGTVYRYQVSAIIGSEEGVKSSEASAMSWQLIPAFNTEVTGTVSYGIPHYYRFNVINGVYYTFVSNVDGLVKYDNGDGWFTKHWGTSGYTASRTGTAYIMFANEGTYTFSIDLDVPSNVRAEAISESSIRVSWNQVEGATGYKVYRTGGSLIATVENALQYEHTGCTGGTVYSYTVSALFNSDEGAKSSEVSAKTWYLLPAFNTEVTGMVSDGIPHYYRFNVINGVTYTFVSNADGLVRYDNGDDWFYKYSGTSSYTASRTGTAYIMFANEGLYTFSIDLPVPTNVQAEEVSESSIRVSWNQVAGATGYKVYTADGDLVAIVGSVSQYEHEDLNAGMVYSYKVSAVFKSYEGAQSEEVTAMRREQFQYFNKEVNTTVVSGKPQYYRFYVYNGMGFTFTVNNAITVRWENDGTEWFTQYYSGTSNRTASRTGWAYFILEYSGTYSIKIVTSEQAVSSFVFSGLPATGPGLVEENKSVTLKVPYGTNLNSLTPSVMPEDGWEFITTGAQNFNNPVEYILTNGSIFQVYTVTITPDGQGGLIINPPPATDDERILGFPVTSFTISRSGSGGNPNSRNITLSSTSYSSIQWWVGETNKSAEATNNGRTFAVQASAYTIGKHTLMVMVYRDGVPYSNEIEFTVVY